MANFMYRKGARKLMQGSINLESDTIKWVLTDTAAYSENQDTDEFLSAIASGDRIAISPALSSKTTDTPKAGVFDAADVTCTSVSGDQSEALMLFKDTGDPATSPLLVKYDAGVTGLPVTPNGGNITIQHPNDANRILNLVA